MTGIRHLREAEAVMVQRLAALREALGSPPASPPATEVFGLLLELAGVARSRGDINSAWLLFVAVAGCFPESEDVLELRRRLELSQSDAEAATETLRATERASTERGIWDKPMRFVHDTVVVDVSFCALNEHNTGVQRLVRETMSRWYESDHPVEFVAWERNSMTRSLHKEELDRVVRWSDPKRSRNPTVSTGNVELIVPLDTVFFVTEVPKQPLCASLAALAEHSGNRTCAIGYDAIPLVSADYVPELESERFARYLSFIKHVDLVIGISRSAADEFIGFADAVKAQGIPGPTTIEIHLPVDLPDAFEAHAPTSVNPLALSVGSHEPRKNQEGILQAAETLWREGLEFRLVFVGAGNIALTAPFDRKLSKLRRAGRQVESRRGIGDKELSALYHAARVTVFPSLHEGYGLPVAESLAAGTPVITTDYGSTAEIGADGGCVLVDPRDDAALTNALRTVLTDDDYLAGLQGEIAARDHRTWDVYASHVWTAVDSIGAK